MSASVSTTLGRYYCKYASSVKQDPEERLDYFRCGKITLTTRQLQPYMDRAKETLAVEAGGDEVWCFAAPESKLTGFR